MTRAASHPARVALARFNRVELAVLAALGTWTLLPIFALLVRPLVNGGIFTGVTGLDPYDQYQYLAWIRDSGTHGLIANQFGMIGGHVFLQPMYLISGLLWRLGLGLQFSYLIWAPISVLILWLGFAAYARRMEPANTGRRAAILVLGLCFATPLGWFSLPATHWVAEMDLGMTDATPALQPWLAAQTAIALGLLALALLGFERILIRDGGAAPRSRLVIGTAAAAALVSWVHSWQGGVLLLIMLGALFMHRPVRVTFASALPLLACAAPLLYQLILSKVDPAWKVAAIANKRPDLVVATPQLAVLGPLLLAAIIGAVRRRPRGDADRMVLLWPLAALAVYLFDPEFPPHALQGVTLPLAVLAVRGWPRRTSFRWLGPAAIAAFTLPGLAYFANSFPTTVRGNRELFFMPSNVHAAFDYLSDDSHPGAVLAPLPLALQIPAFTGRSVWAGHQIWTPDNTTRQIQLAAFYGGGMAPAQARAFVLQTRVGWVFAECGTASATIATLRPITSEVRRFGCVTVARVL